MPGLLDISPDVPEHGTFALQPRRS